MGRIFQRPATHTQYTTEFGLILVSNETNLISGVGASYDMSDYMGVEVYAGKGKLINVLTGKTIALYTRRQRVHIPTIT